MDYELIHRKRELKGLQEEDADLGQYIDKLQQSFSHTASQPSYSDYAFLTFDDVSKLSNCDDNKSNKLVIIKAQPGTVMEVPDPSEVEEYFKGVKKEGKVGTSGGGDPAKNPTPGSDVEDSKYQISLKSKTSEIMVYAVENEEPETTPRAQPQSFADGNEQVETLKDMYAS